MTKQRRMSPRHNIKSSPITISFSTGAQQVKRDLPTLTNRPVGWYYEEQMKTTRSAIIEHAKALAVERGDIPSLNDLAKAAGISKGGLIHYFPSRQSLLEALAQDGIAEVDRALSHAIAQGTTVRTWLELSTLVGDDDALYRSLATTFFAAKSERATIEQLVTEANVRWEALLEVELGSPEIALVARLLADGLLLGVITGSITELNASDHVSTAEAALASLRGASA